MGENLLTSPTFDCTPGYAPGYKTYAQIPNIMRYEYSHQVVKLQLPGFTEKAKENKSCKKLLLTQISMGV